MSLINWPMLRSLAYQKFLNSSIQLFYQSPQVLSPLLPKLLPSLPLLLLQFPNDHHLLLVSLAPWDMRVLLLIILTPIEFFIRLLLLQLLAFLVIILLLLSLLPLFRCVLRFHQQLDSLSNLFLFLLFLLLLFLLNIIFFLRGSFFQMVCLFTKVILLLLQLLQLD